MTVLQIQLVYHFGKLRVNSLELTKNLPILFENIHHCSSFFSSGHPTSGDRHVVLRFNCTDRVSVVSRQVVWWRTHWTCSMTQMPTHSRTCDLVFNDLSLSDVHKQQGTRLQTNSYYVVWGFYDVDSIPHLPIIVTIYSWAVSYTHLTLPTKA